MKIKKITRFAKFRKNLLIQEAPSILQRSPYRGKSSL